MSTLEPPYRQMLVRRLGPMAPDARQEWVHKNLALCGQASEYLETSLAKELKEVLKQLKDSTTRIEKQEEKSENT